MAILRRIPPPARSAIVIVGLPFVLYCLHALAFGGWIIDDAGISFAYARSLAHGYGLVPQPGVTPVEGYSNFTWVLALAPFFLVHLFDPVLTPKILAAVLVLLSYAALYDVIRSVSRHPALAGGICLTLISISTPFVAWTISGLENPLTVLLAVLLLRRMTMPEYGPGNGKAVVLGVLSALLAMTRPEGAVYAAAPALHLLFSRRSGEAASGSTLVRWSVFLAMFVMLFGGFLVFRLWYFHDILPHTYYAKGGPTAEDVFHLLLLQPAAYQKTTDLSNVIASYAGNYVFLILLFIAVVVAYRREWTQRHSAIFLVLLCSVAGYALLPPDWMPERRFATAFVALFYCFAVVMIEAVLDSPRMHRPAWRKAAWASVLSFVALSGFMSFRHTARFIRDPVVPFRRVADENGHAFNTFAAMLGVRNGSLLAADIGGALYYSRLRIVDLGGLTDQTIARTLPNQMDEFHEYVFVTMKPTFIITHSYWAQAANLDADSRFRRDYVPILESVDEWLKTWRDLEILSGAYVRKDAVAGRQSILAPMQALGFSVWTGRRRVPANP